MADFLPINLYHGTSTIFLDSIIENGLGGINPIKEWKLLELSKEIYSLSEQHLQETDLFKVSSRSFKNMSEQSNSGLFNWQHGDTYLSPSINTAARYAINKEFGSEFLTYNIIFLKELIKAKIPYVTVELFKKYKKIFGLIEAKPSPIIVQTTKIPISFLLDEHGNDCASNIEQINELMHLDDALRQLYLQQCNFRLTRPIQKSDLTFWFVNVQEWNPLSPKYNLYNLNSDNSNL
jgi:hypothetical protein